MAKLIPLRENSLQALPFIPEAAASFRVLEVAADRCRRGIRGAMATVIARHGSAPATPGQKLYAGEDRTCVGTIGGGAVEREVIEALAEILGDARAKHRVQSFKLGAELGMCCGGSVDVLLEPLEALASCLIIGGGHVATALAPLLARVGFAVTIVDEREEWGGERFENVRSIVGEYDDLANEIPRSAAVLVMTHDHALDQRAIEWAIAKQFAFVGGVGSRAKAQRTRDRLVAKGVSEAKISAIRMPIGIDIGARLPAEIAIAIAAEMISWRRKIEASAKSEPAT